MREESSEGTTIKYGALHTSESSSETEQNQDISYLALLQKNRQFRLFISSYTVTNCGEWLTYIASIDLIERKLEQSSNESSRTAISTLVLVRLLPNVFFAVFGGHLADSLDRRKLLVILDVMSAICGLFFVLAYELQSIFLVYAATFVQQSLGGLYEPSSQAIVPMLVSDDHELKKATTLQGLVWSSMQALGAAASGFIVDILGSRACFCEYSWLQPSFYSGL